MATIVFAAIGSQIGGAALGGVLGTAIGGIIGRAAGSIVGRAIDQRLFGSETKPEAPTPMSSMRVTTTHHGAPLPEVYGRNRLAGHIIWSGGFRSTEQDGENRYYASFAVALCEGEVHRVGRMWCDSKEIYINPSAYRFYEGKQNQMPDPLIVKTEGEAPAYRGISYIVFEDLELSEYGNRIPNFQFEIFRHAQQTHDEARDHIRAVAMIPGSGEYVYATSPVTLVSNDGYRKIANRHRTGTPSDFVASLRDMKSDLPKLKSVSLIVSWFGDDLRADFCKIEPRVEQNEIDGDQPWKSGGISRAQASQVTQENERPVYGGTPSDASIIQAIREMNKQGIEVMFYPFILMDVPKNNQRRHLDGSIGQPVNPWRGRISLSEDDDVPTGVERFLGMAQPSDFQIIEDEIVYSGPIEWSYRRFILHYAYLCKQAGGVSEFLVGSELRGLTWLKTTKHVFPFVAGLETLAEEVKTILGSDVKIGYAADWSEYFGCAPPDESGAFYFHLDPLWSDENIDFIGIDNYMPLSDWREGEDHQDAHWGSEYNLDYLYSNVVGGEGFDWYYKNKKDRDEQIRTPIEDWYKEPWIWRYKDLFNWWNSPHYNRPNGNRENSETGWKPRSKPIYFTEFGSAAINLATNQPNKFLDPKSSESHLPYFSNAQGDSFIQSQYIRAMSKYWASARNNPISEIYNAPMLNVEKSYYWCWDARPWPEFPGRSDLWSDVGNYERGHWINGRVNEASLASIVAEICAPLGENSIDVSRLYGQVIGVAFRGDETIRQKLEMLMRIFQFHVYVEGNRLVFVSKGVKPKKVLETELFIAGETGETLNFRRDHLRETPAKLDLAYWDAEENYDQDLVTAVSPHSSTMNRELIDANALLSQKDALNSAEQLLRQYQTGEVTVEFRIANTSQIALGDYFKLDSDGPTFLVDRIHAGDFKTVHAVGFETQRLSHSSGHVQLPVPSVQISKPEVIILDDPRAETRQFLVYVAARPWVGVVQAMLADEIEAKYVGAIRETALVSKLDTSLEFAEAHRTQNISLELEMEYDYFVALWRGYLKTGLVALLYEDQYEFIRFESFSQDQDGKLRLDGLQRGLFGTTKRRYEKGAQCVFLGAHRMALPYDLFEAENATLLVFPKGEEEDFAQSFELVTPKQSLVPLPPSDIRFKDDRLHFLPCFKSHDEWDDPILQRKQSFELKLFQSGKLVSQQSTTEYFFDLTLLNLNDGFIVELRAQSETGRFSPLIRREINEPI